jgi:phage-related protein
VATFRSDVIPAVTALWDSFETAILPFIVNTLTNQIIPAVVSLSNTLFNQVIPSISAFIQGNSDAIVKGGTFAAVLIGLSKALGAVVSFVGPIVAKIIAFGSRVVAAGRKVVGLTRFVRSANTALLGMQRASFAARLGLSALGGPIAVMINLFATLAALWIADVGGMRSALAPLVDGITHFGNQMADEVAPAIVSLVTNIVKLGEEITALVTTFLGAGDGIVALEVAMGALRIIIEGLGDAILGIVQAANAVILGLRSLVAFLSGDFQKSARLGKKAIQLMVQGIINIVIGLGQALVGLFGGIIATIVGLVLDLINGIINAFITLAKKVNSNISDLLDDIVSAFANLPQRAAKALVNLGSVIVDAIPTSLEDLENLGDSLAKLGSAMGDAIIAGFNLAKKLGPKLIDALQYLIEDTIDSTTDVASKLAELGSNFAEAISNGVSNIFDGLSGLLDISPSDALDWGRTLIEKIAEGIGKAGKIIKDAIRNAAGKLGKFLPKSPADEGPLSKPNHPEARGKALATDVAKGIEGSESKFEDAVRSLTDTELENISGDVGFDLASMKSKIQEQNIGKGMNTNANQKLSQSSSEDKDKKIEVSEKAIYFEEGAFQGISDEELPMKVREVFDESMRDIVQEIDGAGKQRTN